jgi:hypothetical protein
VVRFDCVGYLPVHNVHIFHLVDEQKCRYSRRNTGSIFDALFPSVVTGIENEKLINEVAE